MGTTGAPTGTGSEEPDSGRTHLPRGPGVAAAPRRPGRRPGRWRRRSPGGQGRTARTWARPGAAPTNTAPTDTPRAGRQLGTGSGRGRHSGRSEMAAAAGGRAHAWGAGPGAGRARSAERGRRGRARSRRGGAERMSVALAVAPERRAGPRGRKGLCGGGSGRCGRVTGGVRERRFPPFTFPAGVLLNFSPSRINLLGENAFTVIKLSNSTSATEPPLRTLERIAGSHTWDGWVSSEVLGHVAWTRSKQERTVVSLPRARRRFPLSVLCPNRTGSI